MDDAVFTYIIYPVIILCGMAVVSVLVDGELGTHGAFTAIFTIAGGIPALDIYFKKAWEKKTWDLNLSEIADRCRNQQLIIP